MRKYSDIRKLAKNYKKINEILLSVESALEGNLWETQKLKKRKIKTDRKSLLKLRRYISIYKAIFLKNYSYLKENEKQIIEGVYMNGKTPVSFCVNNYISESALYRVLKKFDMCFYYDLTKVSRITNTLTDIVKPPRAKIRQGDFLVK